MQEIVAFGVAEEERVWMLHSDVRQHDVKDACVVSAGSEEQRRFYNIIKLRLSSYEYHLPPK